MNDTPPHRPLPQGMVRHQSWEVYCSRRESPAVISVVERSDGPGPVRFVLWCSLRGTDECDEACLCVP